MRVNIYAEELTDRVEIVRKGEFTGVRFYLELPVTLPNSSPPFQARGPFIHHPGDDDSSAVTFWGKRDLKTILARALALLNQYQRDDGYSETEPPLIDKSRTAALKSRLRNKSSEEATPASTEAADGSGAHNTQNGETQRPPTPAPPSTEPDITTQQTATVNKGGESSTAPADTSGQTGHAGTAEASSKATGSPAPEIPTHIALLEGYRKKVGDKAFYILLSKARRKYPEGFSIGHWRTEVPAELADQIIFDLEDELNAQAEARKGRK